MLLKTLERLIPVAGCIFSCSGLVAPGTKYIEVKLGLIFKIKLVLIFKVTPGLLEKINLGVNLLTCWDMTKDMAWGDSLKKTYP